MLQERRLQWESLFQVTISLVDHSLPGNLRLVDLGQTSLVDHSLPQVTTRHSGRQLVDLHHSAVVVRHSSWLACEGKLSDLTQFAATTTRILQSLLQPTQQRRLHREGAKRAKAIALHDHEVREINRPGNIGLEHELAHRRDV